MTSTRDTPAVQDTAEQCDARRMQRQVILSALCITPR